MTKSFLEGLKISVPKTAAYKAYWCKALIGTGWDLASGYEFFKTDKPSDLIGNYDDEGELCKNSPVTVFGAQLVLKSRGGTIAQERELFFELIEKGVLEFRRGSTRIDAIPSHLVPGGSGIQSLVANMTDVSADATTDYGEMHNGPVDPKAMLPIPKGIVVEPGSSFNVKQLFLEDTARAAVNALNALDTKYMLVLHTMVHEPEKANSLGCSCSAPAGQVAVAG